MGKKSICEQHRSEILRLNALGYSRHEMADLLGLTKTQIQAFLQRRGIRPLHGGGKGVFHHLAEIRQMIGKDRRTQQEVADFYGVHLSAVERLLSSSDVKTSRTGPRAAAEHHQRWQGGRILSKWWYIDVYAPLHPLAKKSGYVAEHRLMVEVMLGRYLSEKEVVDHRDSHTQHNWPSNLALYTANADHLRATLTARSKYSRIRSIFGDWVSSRRSDPIPSLDDTLALCPADTREKFERHVEIHRPTKEHARLSRKKYWRQGPWSDPFQ